MSWRADTRTSVVVFAREPRAGRVKTRLIPLLGAEGAARLHARLVAHALATARTARLGKVELWSTRRQRGADLGARMQHAFAHTLRRAARVILMGADAPALRPSHLRRAARWLAGGADAVFAPAEDGGYALVALRRAAPRLFEGIEWGGPRVMAQTRARLAALGWRWRELPEVWDVDRPEDVARLRRVPGAHRLRRRRPQSAPESLRSAATRSAISR
jgi:hypothetical protein